MTRREKLQASITDDQLWDLICTTTTCIGCPLLKMCKKAESIEEFKAWLDEEVKDDGSV